MTSDLDLVERRQLCGLFDDLGPDAPTLCDGWTTGDLAAHLVVRERRPLAMPGILVEGRAEQLTERSMARERRRHAFAATVERVRTGPPPGPLRIAPLRHALNLFEFTVHHEDVRRANGAAPRTDRPDLDDDVWGLLLRGARLLVSRAHLDGIRLVLDRGGDATITVGTGHRVARIEGAPVEVLLYLHGRRAVSTAQLTGDDDAVAAVAAAPFGV